MGLQAARLRLAKQYILVYFSFGEGEILDSLRITKRVTQIFLTKHMLGRGVQSMAAIIRANLENYFIG